MVDAIDWNRRDKSNKIVKDEHLRLSLPSLLSSSSSSDGWKMNSPIVVKRVSFNLSTHTHQSINQWFFSILVILLIQCASIIIDESIQSKRGECTENKEKDKIYILNNEREENRLRVRHTELYNNSFGLMWFFTI